MVRRSRAVEESIASGIPPCPICGASSFVVGDDLYDDRYGYPGGHTLLACTRCRHKFLASAFTDSQLRSLYSDYYPRSAFRLEDFRAHTEVRGLNAWLEGEFASAFRWVPKGVRVLDVGCGFGQTLAYHANRGCEAHGIDADMNLLRVANRYRLNARVGLFAAKDYEADSFDYVTLDQVIEHVADPRSFLRDVATVLRPGGTLIVTTPNSNGYGGRLFGRRWINWHVPFHLQQFSRRSLSVLAMQSGLRPASIRTLTNSRWLHYQWLHLFAYPPSGTPSPFWDAARSPLAVPAVPERVCALLYRIKLFHMVTRLADVIGLGDNFLCILRKPI